MKNKRILTLLLLIIGISGCKKYGHRYPEDPERTEKTSMERLTNKWWKLKQTFVNGKDYTDTVENAIGEFQIYFSTSKESTMYLGSYKSSLNSNGGAIVWISNDQKEVIDFVLHHTAPSILTYAPLHYPYNSSNYGGARILKLTESEFKITSYNQQADTIVTNLFTL
jgi:hypothetical protein